MNVLHVKTIGMISAFFGLIMVTDSLDTSLAIGSPLTQVGPDWMWALAFCTLSMATVMLNNRKKLLSATLALQLLTVLWVAVTVPRIINLLPSSVLYLSMTLFCIRTYINVERGKPHG